MIHSIFELGETTVKEIMVPRIDVKGLDIQTNFSTTLKTVSSWGHSRIPVYEENIDSIIGILYAKDLLEWVERPSPQEWALSSMIKKPHFVPLGKPVDEMLKEFKQKHIHIAIVVDEYGGTAGLVTMEDILEEIVGEIHDEYDTEINPIVKTGDSTYLIDPHLDLHDLTEELNIALDVDDAEYNTLSGLIYHEYGDIPQKNTEFNYKGLHIKVMEMDNQRIEKVQVSLGNHHSAIKDRKN